MVIALTGAWSYSGRPIASALLRAGHTVVSLTSRLPPEPDPHHGQVRPVPYGQFRVPDLARGLADVEVMVCGYWVRHNRAPVGHRGHWTSHAEAVSRSSALIEAAKQAGVRRLVWTSIANPGLDPDLSYYEGKARVEKMVLGSGLEAAILRPACFFGRNGILLDNIAWAARRLPLVPIPAGPPYWIRPIHVDDFAELAADAAVSHESWTRDAAGPDRYEFGELIREVASVVGGPGRPIRLPLPACRLLYAAASRVFGETILTSDELKGLSRNRLDSTEDPIGTTSLRTWLVENAADVGKRLAREPKR